MKLKAVSGIIVILFLTVTLSISINECQSIVEEWVPYVPSSKMVDLEFWMSNGTSYINVSITFPDSGYMVSDWGTVVREGGEIWVDAEIWDWTGYSFLVITTLSYSYNLGCLEGYYTFTFKAWGTDVKSVSFKATTVQMLLETDKDTYLLGENVTITLKNIGTETVSIGGYPAWQILTYPEEEPVYPEIYAWLAWSLMSGENDTFTWNQYNGFTQSSAKPGMYVIKDTQGWGLSTYFKIIATEKIVPDDYPTIQEAINAAGDRDTIFVRAGTYFEKIVVNKTVSLVGENRDTTIIDGNETGVVLLIEAVYVTVEGFTVKNGGKQFSGVDIFSNGNNVTNNIILNNWCGIRLEHYTTDNTLANNKITSNLNGISGELWSNSLVIDNRITNNLLGIWMHLASGNIIANNTVSGHLDGLWISHSTGNFILSNTIINNKWSGVSLEYSSNNRIYHNNFVDNGKQACTYGEIPNHWDNDYPSGGNYWSDYAGVDEFSGPYQNETGSDGIGDTPYIIDEKNQDRYPLMKLEDQLVPYVPDPEEVDLAFWIVNEIAYVNVTIKFSDPCFNITDWGTIIKTDYNIWVDSEIWRWTGGCILIVPPPVCHTYELGPLESGTYTFSFQAWGVPVESIVFTIPPSPGIHITGIKPPEGPPGTEVSIFGGGATPEGAVVALFSGPLLEIPDVKPLLNITVGRTVADEEGYWNIQFGVPSLSTGKYVVYVVDNATQTSALTIFYVTPMIKVPFQINYVSPQSGPVGTSVYISGSGATPNGEVRVYFGEPNVANTTAKEGWWSASFEVPDVEPGNYTIMALDVTTSATDTASLTVTPPPIIHVSPPEAPIGSKITITGEGFPPNQGIYITFEDLLLFCPITTDENGEFNITLFVPMVNSGNYIIKARLVYPYVTALANASFTVTLGIDTLLSESSSEHDSLLSNSNDLQSKPEDLTGDLRTARNLSHIFIITTIILIATTAYLAIRKPKVKPGLETT